VSRLRLIPAIVVNDVTGTSGDLLPWIESAGRAALANGVVPDGLLGQVEISITLVGRDRIRELNRVYHGVNRVTDVLAFSLESPTASNDVHTDDGPEFLGDVYVCPGVAQSHAARFRGIDPSEELLRLVIHGVLHLMGYEHSDGKDRYECEMFRLQEKILTDLSFVE
jgi:probable rRNA maturation factor